jgi:transposase
MDTVLDNLGSHKGEAVRAAIRAAGARLVFLPPYSPDLNPIEQVFAKLKHFMRKAAERTVESTWMRSGELLKRFLPDECQRYLQNSGYASS